MTHAELVAELTEVVLHATERVSPPGGLTEDEVLFGTNSRLGLDSLDGLQISMAVQSRFGIRMTDSGETRRALRSIGHLVQYVVAHTP